MISSPVRSSAVMVALASALVLLSGCATASRVSYLTAPGAAAKVAAYQTPRVAPPKVEVFELTAGGVREKRDDWTKQATQELGTAYASHSGYQTALGGEAHLDPQVQQELAEVHALLQLITVNHVVTSLMGPRELMPLDRPLTYNVGRIDHLLDALHADCLLFTSVHDEYSTGGRKALMALGFLVGAATGVMIVPTGGTTVNGAALVERDGTVLWFNTSMGGGDLRTAEGARTTAQTLLAGLPTHTPSPAPSASAPAGGTR